MDALESSAGTTEEAGVLVVDGGPLAATTKEAGIVVIAGESAATEADAVKFTTGEGASMGSICWRGTEEVAGRIAGVELPPPPPRRLVLESEPEPEPESEPESPAAELVAMGFDGGASPASYPDPE